MKPAASDDSLPAATTTAVPFASGSLMAARVALHIPVDTGDAEIVVGLADANRAGHMRAVPAVRLRRAARIALVGGDGIARVGGIGIAAAAIVADGRIAAPVVAVDR